MSSAVTGILLKTFTLIVIFSTVFYTFAPKLYIQQTKLFFSNVSLNNSEATASVQSSADLTMLALSHTVRNQTNGLVIDSHLIYFYKELEPHLCDGIKSFGDTNAYKPENRPCPQNGIVSVINGGRTEHKAMSLAAGKLLKIFTLIVFFSTVFYILSAKLSIQLKLSTLALNRTEQNQGNALVIDSLLIYPYKELDSQLCDGKNSFEDKTVYKPEKRPCPQNGIVSVITGGRTGNQMWEYAAVWAIAQRTGLEPYIPMCIKKHLESTFDNLTLPVFEEIAHCPVQFTTYVTTLEEWTSMDQGIILPRWVTLPHLVLPFINYIRPEFQFNKKIREKAELTLTEYVKKLPPKQYTFVGVHVRRTDYIPYLKRKYGLAPVTQEFFLNAMNYYRHKYPNCLFIYISDDPKWCVDHFGHLEDVFVASYDTKNTAAEDMAIMAACNHSIFDYGTYGEWGSFLAGGEAVCNNMTQNYPRVSVMKKWIMMD